MPNHTQPVQETPASFGQGVTQTHPSFATAIVSRGSGSSRALFQSDVLHQETIRLAIHRADRTRDLNRDWVHPTTQVVEVEMSLAQWGALVSSMGVGSGTPVTLRRTEVDGMVPDLPFQPRLAENLEEVQTSVAKQTEQVRQTADALAEAIESKAGVKAIREALRNHQAAVANMPANAAFAVKSMTKAAEKVVSHARADIEAYALRAAQATGLEAPVSLPPMQITATQED